MDHRVPAALIGLLLLATGIRLAGLTREPFWYDEVCSFELSRGGIAKVVETAAKDSSPFLFYLGVAGWRGLFGDSEAAMRGFSLAFSIAGMAGAFLLARDLSRSARSGLIAAGLIAVNPVDIYFAQEARMYTHVATLLTFGSWFLWRWLRSVLEKRGYAAQTAWALAFVFASTVAIFTHYLAALAVGAQGTFGLVVFVRGRDWRSVRILAAGAALSVATFLPWRLYVSRFRDNLYFVHGLRWMTPPSLWDATGRLFHELIWGAGTRWGAAGTAQIVLSAAAALLVIAGLTWVLGRRALPPGAGTDASTLRPSVALIYSACLVLGPVFLVVVLSHAYHPLFYRPRFAMLVVLPFLVTVALTVTALPRRALQTASLAFIGGLMIAGSFAQFRAHTKTGMLEFAALWHRLGPPAFVVFVPTYTAEMARYYLHLPVKSASKPEIEAALSGGHDVEIWLCKDRHPVTAPSPEERDLLAWLPRLGVVAPLGKYDVYDVVRIVTGASAKIPPS